MTHATGNHIYDKNGNCINCDKVEGEPANCDHSVSRMWHWKSPWCYQEGLMEYECYDCYHIWGVVIPVTDEHRYDGGETCVYCGHQKDDLTSLLYNN